MPTTPNQFRKLALSFPDTEEGFHVDHPDFRVRGKIFAGLGRGETHASFRVSPETQAMLVDASSAFTRAAGAWGDRGWTYAALTDVTIGQLRDAVAESYAMIEANAPKKKAKAKAAVAKKKTTTAPRAKKKPVSRARTSRK